MTLISLCLRHQYSAESVVHPTDRRTTCRPSINTCVTWRDLSVLIGRISMTLGMNIHHVSGQCSKVFKVRGWRSFVPRQLISSVPRRSLLRLQHPLVKGQGHEVKVKQMQFSDRRIATNWRPSVRCAPGGGMHSDYRSTVSCSGSLALFTALSQ